MTDDKRFWSKLWESIPEINNFDPNDKSLGIPEKIRVQLADFLDLLAGKRIKSDHSFLHLAARAMRQEWQSPQASELRENASRFLHSDRPGQYEILNLFFPEFQHDGSEPYEQVENLKNQRTINIKSLNPEPITDPSKELVFTSNVLLTLPPDHYMDKLSKSMRLKIEEIKEEKQQYWFDHPILMGVEKGSNEMIYGLQGLAQSFQFEKERGIIPPESRMTVILSLSVTHDGLKSVAQEYLSQELSGIDGLDDLDVFLFTEEDTKEVSKILGSLLEDTLEHTQLEDVFGVDGRYGRHYSFLKAIVPLWAIAVDPGIKGTFKIDLDQIFPQKELKEQTGKTAFEHFMTPLWGALGTDCRGKDVELGMIAGALVNERDIHKSIFTPDVPLPDETSGLSGENRVFFKQYPMALSTLAEMMTTYESERSPDGIHSCLSRVHVTGGTNGILCKTLRDKRPFTPTFIGRAEDQAYLLSVLMEENSPVMRYVHEPGLIMRHDKEAFAGDSIEASKLGTWVADLLRIIYFSYYAALLPGGVKEVKRELDPFTGCFISTTPMIKVFLRLILKILEEPSNAELLMELAENQLSPFIYGEESEKTVEKRWKEEKMAWNHYYDALDILELGIKSADKSIVNKAEILKNVLLGTRIK